MFPQGTFHRGLLTIVPKTYCYCSFTM